MVSHMSISWRVILVPLFLVLFSGLSAWTVPFAFGGETTESTEDKDLSNQSVAQEPGIEPQPTTVTETGYLELEQGFVGDKLGAEIERITVDETDQFQVIDIKIPFENPNAVDYIQVIGPAGKTIPQFKPAKISRDHEANNVGVKLFLSKNRNWVFKVKLVEDSPN